MRLALRTNLVIPIILSITIIVAGIFAFTPVQQVSTVHGQIIEALEGPISDLDADHDQILESVEQVSDLSE